MKEEKEKKKVDGVKNVGYGDGLDVGGGGRSGPPERASEAAEAIAQARLARVGGVGIVGAELGVDGGGEGGGGRGAREGAVLVAVGGGERGVGGRDTTAAGSGATATRTAQRVVPRETRSGGGDGEERGEE